MKQRGKKLTNAHLMSTTTYSRPWIQNQTDEDSYSKTVTDAKNQSTVGQLAAYQLLSNFKQICSLINGCAQIYNNLPGSSYSFSIAPDDRLDVMIENMTSFAAVVPSIDASGMSSRDQKAYDTNLKAVAALLADSATQAAALSIYLSNAASRLATLLQLYDKHPAS